jgi:uncharacterized delta-60 repeat protein
MSSARSLAFAGVVLLGSASWVACTGSDPVVTDNDEKNDADGGQTSPTGTGAFALRPLAPAILAPNETLRVPVEIERKDGFSGAVKIVVQPLAEGIGVAPLSLAGELTKGELVVTANSSAKPGVTRLQVVATADPALSDTKDLPFVVRGSAGTRETTYGEKDGDTILPDILPFAYASTADDGLVIVSQTSVARVRADGKVETAFGAGGRTTLDKDRAGRTVAVRVAKDGKILVFTYTNDRTLLAVHRLLAEGGYDTTYGTNGVATLPFAKPEDQPYVFGGDVDAEGRAVVGVVPGLDGTSLVVRFLADGKPDTAFNDQGLKMTTGGWQKMRLSGGTPVFFGGAFYDPGSSHSKFALALVTSTPSSPRELPISTNLPTVEDATFDAQGRMLIAGNAVSTGSEPTSLAVVIRANADGTSDSTFADTGAVADTLGASQAYSVFYVALGEASGKTIAIGSRDSETPLVHELALARYDALGRPDPTFGTNGLVLEDLSSDALAKGGYLQSIPTIVTVRASSGATVISRYWR